MNSHKTESLVCYLDACPFVCLDAVAKVVVDVPRSRFITMILERRGEKHSF
jgi:hypothetical protein